ncbi:MAG: hydroxysqualene dehydroxylase HpnE [Hyphomicrobiales bacterium]
MATAHVIGAGVAGLAAAVDLADKGYRVSIYEQTAQPGGRCRSFHDPLLDAVIDNGNHLLLSGNRSALEYLDRIGAKDRLISPGRAAFPFFDYQTGERWTVEINRGALPWWILDRDRRVRGTTLADYLEGVKLLNAGDRTVAQLFKRQGQFYRRFWDPFTVAVLNTPPEEAAARLLLPVIRETLALGAEKATPLIAKKSLSDTFVDPALSWLKHHGAQIETGVKVRAIETGGGRATAIVTAKGPVPLAADDWVVVAVPAWTVQELLPDVSAPDEFAPIVNVHFRIEGVRQPLMQEPLLGMVGSTTHWVFIRDDIASVTVSAAGALTQKPNADIAAEIWPEVAAALSLPLETAHKARVTKEHRATFLATPAQLAKRPKPKTPLANVVLAGEWVDTGLPTTIEGAIRSGQTAAGLVGAGR